MFKNPVLTKFVCSTYTVEALGDQMIRGSLHNRQKLRICVYKISSATHLIGWSRVVQPPSTFWAQMPLFDRILNPLHLFNYPAPRLKTRLCGTGDILVSPV